MPIVGQENEQGMRDAGVCICSNRLSLFRHACTCMYLMGECTPCCHDLARFSCGLVDAEKLLGS